MKKRFCLFSGSGHPLLSKLVAKKLKASMGKLSIEKFPDGEISIQILEDVFQKDCFVIQPMAFSPDSLLMELLIIGDALRRSSARSLTAIIPYFGYARQDRSTNLGTPITGKLVASMIEKAGYDRVITLDLHSFQMEGFFDIPIDNIDSISLFASKLKKESKQNLIVVSPDTGGLRRAKSFAVELSACMAFIHKIRTSPHEVEAHSFIGDVKGKNVLIIDDLCSTANTLILAANECKAHGAKKIFAAITHGLFVEDAWAKIQNSAIDTLWTTNSVPRTLEKNSKIQTVDISSLLAKQILAHLN